MMRRIVFATNNPHKLHELRQMAAGRFDILSLDDIGCHDDIPETADTIEGNAQLKARWVKDRYGYDCFADDTGLEVDALDGAPGVFTARFAGEGCTPEQNVDLLLQRLDGVKNRTARFRTVIALMMGDDVRTFEGIVEGSIATARQGDGGFGYDPVFIPKGWNTTFAMATPGEKNAISHRGRATRLMLEYIENQL